MIKWAIAKRYAKALVDIGRDKDSIEKFRKELRLVESLVSQNREFKMCILSPVFEPIERKRVIEAISEKTHISREMTHFLYFLLSKDRMKYISQILEAYEGMADEVQGKVRAKVLTAFTLSEEEKELLKNRLEMITEKDVIMDIKDDHSIVGGIIVQVGSVQYDGSLKTSLQYIREKIFRG